MEPDIADNLRGPDKLAGIPMHLDWEWDTFSYAFVDQYSDLARELHRDQTYDGWSYFARHLAPVAYMLRYIGARPATIAAGWLHDAIEDCVPQDVAETRDRIARAVLYGEFSDDLSWQRAEPSVLHMVEAVSDDMMGVNRRERKAGMTDRMARVGEEAALIKLADRLMNVRASSHSYYLTRPAKSRFEMYRKEMEQFRHAICLVPTQTAWGRHWIAVLLDWIDATLGGRSAGAFPERSATSPVAATYPPLEFPPEVHKPRAVRMDALSKKLIPPQKI